MAASAYVRIATMIERGDLDPGAVLTEASLMAAADTGRTPLREALQRLLRERWLEAGTGRGLRVPPISLDDQLARLEVRRPLEVLAVELAAVRADARQLAAVGEHMRALADVRDHEDYLSALARSHELIRGLANNDHLADALQPLQGLSRRFWLATTRDRQDEVEIGRSLYTPALGAVVRQDAAGAREAILLLHDHLADSALDWARRRAEQARFLPPSPRV
ncbi:GntR family transcriptional regulator [Micrococcus flavus]|nr:GntR family transcriptional regulator [Micrococcus flavus]